MEEEGKGKEHKEDAALPCGCCCISISLCDACCHSRERIYMHANTYTDTEGTGQSLTRCGSRRVVSAFSLSLSQSLAVESSRLPGKASCFSFLPCASCFPGIIFFFSLSRLLLLPSLTLFLPTIRHKQLPFQLRASSKAQNKDQVAGAGAAADRRVSGDRRQQLWRRLLLQFSLQINSPAIVPEFSSEIGGRGR